MHAAKLKSVIGYEFATLAVSRMEAASTHDATAIANLSDEALVAAVLQNPDQYAEILRRYEAPLDRYMRRLGVATREDRQDVLQEVFIKAYRNLHGFDQNLSFSSWLYRITHNEAISWYRKRSVRPEGHLVGESDTILSFVEASGLAADSLATERLNATQLERALAALPGKYRDVLVLRFFEYKDYDEISDILKIPVGTVGTLLHRGKARLREQLSESNIDI